MKNDSKSNDNFLLIYKFMSNWSRNFDTFNFLISKINILLYVFYICLI